VAQGRRLSADDWTVAALDALAAGGVGAVAVEPLAARLGATKGSFYWHFRNRDALLEATLARWERTDTEDVIAQADAEPDLRRRLRWLFRAAIGGPAGLPTASSVELALQPAAAHPLVAPALARVTRRRIDYLGTVFTDLGLPPATARHRALLAYTAYLGTVRLARAAPEAVPADLDVYADEVVATLTAP
jgi:AcrR family transcriptional regulator